MGWEIDEFIEAFVHALAEHEGAYRTTIDLDMLKRTLVHAQWIAGLRADSWVL